MGAQYREFTGEIGEPTTHPTLRHLHQRPGDHDEDGNPIYFTEQQHKKECDVNHIIAKYDRTGLVSHMSRFEARFGDMAGIEFKTALDMIHAVQNDFDQLPSHVRSYFNNSPEQLITFMENPDNREKAIELGIIDQRWTEATDGLGEHVKDGKHQDKEDPNVPPPAAEPPAA